MSWFVLSLFSVISLATAELLQQYILTNKTASFNERTSLFLTLLCQVVLVAPIVFLGNNINVVFEIFKTPIIWQYFLVCFIGSISGILYFKSFKVKNISLSTIFMSFSTVVSTSLGIVFLSESTSTTKLLGIFLVITAIILLYFNNLTLEKNHIWGMLAGFVFGIAYTLDKSIVLTTSPFIYYFWLIIGIATFSFLISPNLIVNEIKTRKIEAYYPIFISGIAYFIYNICTLFAYTFGGEVGRIDAINNSQVFLIILFEYLVLKHTNGMTRKILAAVIAYTGVVILGLF